MMGAGFPDRRGVDVGTVARVVVASLWLVVIGCNRGTTPPPPESAREHTRPVVMVPIAEGPFIAGSDRRDPEQRATEFGGRRPWYLDEHPLRTEPMGPYLIDRHEVTEGEYAEFVHAIAYTPPPHWEDTPPSGDNSLLPVVHVNWMDAQNYCHWRQARLPTELEWEKAARGADGAEYPWGDRFDATRANLGQLGHRAPVGHFSESASPYGILDLAGNVWEWTASWYLPYPGNDTPSPLYGRRLKVLRGGGFGGTDGGHYGLAELTGRGSYRFILDPRERVADVGFRCVVALDRQGNTVDDLDRKLHE